ncbi:Nn.00g047660.m01.CDS01 [Neocucurbitaria sp. VM-36]
MTRRIVYGVGLILTLASTIMTIASIAMPRWVSYSPDGKREFSYGLHRGCSVVSGKCTSFPTNRDCTKDPSFCNMWRTVGFLLSFGVVVELCALVSFVVIIAGGVQRRVAGWQVAAGVLAFSAVVQCAGMAIVAFLFDHDSRFWDGWYLDISWSLCTASWTILTLTCLAIVASAIYLPVEGDYELIPDQSQVEPDDQ